MLLFDEMSVNKSNKGVNNGPSTRTNQGNGGGGNSSTKKTFFKPYLSLEETQRGLKRGELIKASLRINVRNFEEAYIDDPSGGVDILILGVVDRNRALQNDAVAVKLKPRQDWLVLNANNPDSISKTAIKTTVAKEVAECAQVEAAGFKADDDDSELAKKLLDLDLQAESNNQVGKPVAAPSLSKKPSTPKISDLKRVADFPDKCFSDDGLQKIGEVVHLIEKKHNRVGAGSLRPMQDKSDQWILFSPRDSRTPRMMIPTKECPPTFLTRPQDFEKFLFIGRIVEWADNSKFAKGTLCKSLGEAGEIEPETEALLTLNGIDPSEFSDSVLECLPNVSTSQPWTIPESEFAYRRDLRNELIFTIDPTTARDLDDALHVKELPDGFYEVGVHIADVSYFVKSDTSLDSAASSRATSVYLVQKVVPMLPRLLCEELCSLNPGVDRLAFSVIWKMNAKGVIYDEWFGRSVIRSRCKLTYDVAQGFLNEPNRKWAVEELPPISGNVLPEDIASRVLILNEMAVNMRKRRHEGGALRIDQPKLTFSLNKETGFPNGCSVYELKDSNRLVEEFMLLANMAVAHRIYKHFEKTAILRRHPPPKEKILRETVEICAAYGMKIDSTSSTTLHNSVLQYHGQSEKAQSLWAVLMMLISKPMQLAVYFCTGSLEDEHEYRHYALNVPLYTHFTSPIRRYPDIMVHRLLAASLDYQKAPELELEQVEKLMQFCNDAKTAAKAVSDASLEMFFSVFVKQCGPIDEKAIVVNVMDHSFDVLLLKFGLTKRVYCDKLPLQGILFEPNEDNEALNRLGLHWPSGKIQVLKMFVVVDAILVASEEPLKFNTLVKPLD